MYDEHFISFFFKTFHSINLIMCEIFNKMFYNSTVSTDETTWLGPNHRGHMYLELYLAFPWVRRFYTDWEVQINNEPVFDLMVYLTPFVPIVSVVSYLATIVGLKKYMVNRPAYDLKIPLAMWNLFLSVFSFFGAVRTVPHLLWLFAFVGPYKVMCGDPETLYGTGSIGLWCQSFVLSKIAELFDTVFIILRKRPLSFLHWYHHATVLLFCWITYVNSNPGLVFISMNYFVHSVMYSYYFLSAFKKWPKWINPQYITVLQISQMVVGVFCVIYYMLIFSEQQPCSMYKEVLMACGAMYSTYLYLFAEYFVKRFISRFKQA